jgi:hypothetical protein
VQVLAVIVNHERPELVLQGLKSLGPEFAVLGGGCKPQCWLVPTPLLHEEFMKNHGPGKSSWRDVAWTLGFLSWRARRRFQGKADDDPPHLLSDFVRFNFPGG